MSVVLVGASVGLVVVSSPAAASPHQRSAIAVAATTDRVTKGHLVIVDKGVGGAVLGDSERSVRKVLGPPTATSPRCGGSGSKTPGCVEWQYKATNRAIAFAHGKLVYVVFGSKKDMTATHIGLSAQRKVVSKAFPKCPGGFGYCYLEGRGTTKPPRSGDPVTFVNFSSETKSAVVDRFVIARYGSKYLNCIFGCG
jgi:hypothetical protein